MGGVFGVCSVVGPLVSKSPPPPFPRKSGIVDGLCKMGGALTANASWRWCFYINLPIGAVAAVGVISLLHVKQSLLKLKGTIWTRLALFDPLGNLAFIGSAVSLLLALQFAFESSYLDRRVIALFVLFAVLFIALLILQWTLGESSTLPARVVKYRTISFGSLFVACIGASTFIVLNYLPIWFQVVQKQSPTSSALRTLPLVVAQIISTLVAGILTTRLGHYMPFVYAAAIFMPIGVGLATTFSLHTPTSHWIGYEILIGIGIGAGFQQARVAAQHLKSSIKALGIPGLDPGIVVATGATEVGKLVSPNQIEEVLAAYNDAIMKAFQLALIQEPTPAAKLFSVKPEEIGERVLGFSSAQFGGQQETEALKADVAASTNGKVGGGAYSLKHTGQVNEIGPIYEKLRASEFKEKAWDHTTSAFKAIEAGTVFQE
ncbi:major facilitator superfamily protein [Diaporthe eres]|nr:major facilitator superfamily protein [Diaporthe eres]